MQKIIICGNLTANPILSEREWTDSSTGEILKAKVCNFTVAADDGFKENKHTEYFRVTAWRGLAELCADILNKGDRVLVEGVIRLKNYTDKNNNHRTAMEIRPDMIEFENSRTAKSEDVPVIEAEAAEDSDGMDY